LPLRFFQFRGWIERELRWRLWLIFGLGALQGAIGWWMVASGLVGRVDVAQECLSIHLTMACLPSALVESHRQSLTVQFIHRMVAYLLVAPAALHAADCTYHRSGRVSAITLACLLLLQATLGVATLISHVSILLALAHQSVAVVALIVAVVHAANLRPAHRKSSDMKMAGSGA
jgi:heme A synthase